MRVPSRLTATPPSLPPLGEGEELLVRWNRPHRPSVAPDGDERLPSGRNARSEPFPGCASSMLISRSPVSTAPHLEPSPVAEEASICPSGLNARPWTLVAGVRRAEHPHAPARRRVPQHRPPRTEVRVVAETGRDEGTVRAVLDVGYPPRRRRAYGPPPPRRRPSAPRRPRRRRRDRPHGLNDASSHARSDRGHPGSGRRIEYPASTLVAGDEMCAVVVVRHAADTLPSDALGPQLGSCRVGHVPDAGRCRLRRPSGAACRSGRSPRAQRARVAGEAHELFTGGRVPDPAPCRRPSRSPVASRHD